MKHPITLLMMFITLLTWGCHADNESAERPLSGEIAIYDMWLRPAAAGANSAAYLSLYNGTDRADTLLSVGADAFEQAHIHESYLTEEGLSSMRKVKNAGIPSADSLILRPGGMHLMLTGAKKDLALSDTVIIRFRFKVSGEKSAALPVGRPE